jgi:Cyclic nucleotide-binding domain/Tetratricopeptide repeat
MATKEFQRTSLHMFWFNRSTPGPDALIAEERYSEAIDLLRRELRRKPGNVRARLSLAKALAANQQVSDAALVYEGLFYSYLNTGSYARAAVMIKQLEQLRRGTTALIAALSEHTQTASRGKSAWLRKSSRQTPARRADAPLEADAPSRTLGVLFASMAVEELDALVSHFRLLLYSAGDIIVTEDEEGSSVFILALGTAKVWVRNSTGQNALVRALAEGDFFGEIAYLSGGKRSATITTATPAEVLELPSPAMAEIAGQYPSVLDKLTRAFNERWLSGAEMHARS